MKRLFSIFLFIAGCQVVVGQTATFSKIFNDSTSLLSGGMSITSFNDSIYFSLFAQGQPDNYQAAVFIKTDPSGNQIRSCRFYQPNYFYSSGDQGSLKITSDGYLICGGYEGSLSYTNGFGDLFKFDRTTLDTLYVKKYSHGNVSGFYGFEQLSDNNYLFSGIRGDTTILGNDWFWMVKTDTSGTLFWQKSLISDNFNTGGSASAFKGGFYQPWVTGHLNTINDGADSVSFVDRYDDSGNLIWRDTFGIVGNENMAGPGISLKDGGALLFLNKLDTSAPDLGLSYVPSVLYKIDSNGLILWQRYFPSQPQFKNINNVIESSSGSLIFCGTAQSGFVSVDTEGHANALIFKLDKNGNQIFNQLYNYDTTWSDVLNDITETADGGYACIGNAFERMGNTNYERAWLLKVDSNGCLNGDCPQIQTGIKDIPGLASFFVFPNPVSSQFTVALAGPNDLERYSDLHFMLYDLTGREVMNETLKQQTTILQSGDISQGMYVWQIGDGSSILSKGKLVFK